MILPLVSELLSRVGRQPAVDKAIEALRYGAGVSRLAGLSDPAKAIVTALTAARLPRPGGAGGGIKRARGIVPGDGAATSIAR